MNTATNEQYVNFSTFLLESKTFEHIPISDRQTIVILAKLIFIDDVKEELLTKLLKLKYLKEVE